MSDWSELKRLAEEATPGRNFDRLPSAGGGLKYTCTGDDGSLVLRVDHKNDEFGFIGERGQEDEAFFLACTPAAILALIAESERLINNRDMWKGPCYRQAEELTKLRSEVEQLRGDLALAKQAPMYSTRLAAERYRYLRACHWNDSPLAVVRDPKQQVKLGADCPSGDLLDAVIDAAMSKGQSNG